MSQLSAYCDFQMFLKVLQEVCHSLVTFKVVEVVVDPEQNNPSDLLENAA